MFYRSGSNKWWMATGVVLAGLVVSTNIFYAQMEQLTAMEEDQRRAVVVDGRRRPHQQQQQLQQQEQDKVFGLPRSSKEEEEEGGAGRPSLRGEKSTDPRSPQQQQQQQKQQDKFFGLPRSSKEEEEGVGPGRLSLRGEKSTETRSTQQQQQPQEKPSSVVPNSSSSSNAAAAVAAAKGKDHDDDKDDAEGDPFLPPLYGYQSMTEMNGRSDRFPSATDRVKVYMSNWYLPPCPLTAATAAINKNDPTKSGANGNKNDYDWEDGRIHYRYATMKSNKNKNNNTKKGAVDGDTIYAREIVSGADSEPSSGRIFEMTSEARLGKLHFMDKGRMQPDRCDSEYCADLLQHWYPVIETIIVAAVLQGAPSSPTAAARAAAVPPWLFQFSDDELSRSYSPEARQMLSYPNIPHLKKSRLSLHPRDILTAADATKCAPQPKQILPTAVPSPDVPEHLQPSQYLFCRCSCTSLYVFHVFFILSLPVHCLSFRARSWVQSFTS
jgi:hypothetical protein